MAVTKQTYTANATWTASQLADIFRSAFIDAGLMTEWHDSFLSDQIENRILRVVYDGTKTYGATFYWFMFTTAGVRLHLATGWNTTTKIPTGTQYVDYFSTTTNTLSNHAILSTVSNTTNVSLIRYTSQDSPGITWFNIRQGTSFIPFMIFPSSSQIASWIDLNKTFFHHFITPVLTTDQSAAILSFNSRCGLRRSFLLGSGLPGSTTSQAEARMSTACYTILGRSTTSSNNDDGLGLQYVGTPSGFSFILPLGTTTANPAYTTNSNPIFNGMPFSLYVSNTAIPPDFAIIPHFSNNTMAPLDKFVVTSGVEEWEIITVVNNTTAVTGASVALAARVV
jgi:hypothetical protein